MIDWTDPTSQISAHFTVKDVAYLHQWNRLANESDGLDSAMKDKLVALCQTLETIRSFIGFPMNSHCGFRSKAYNKLIGAPESDVHEQGLALDFDCSPNMSISDVQAKLRPKLEELGIRMERNTPTWVHVDTHAVGNAREFYP